MASPGQRIDLCADDTLETVRFSGSHTLAGNAAAESFLLLNAAARAGHDTALAILRRYRGAYLRNLRGGSGVSSDSKCLARPTDLRCAGARRASRTRNR